MQILTPFYGKSNTNLIIAPHDYLLKPFKFNVVLIKHNVSRLTLTPSIYDLLCSTCWKDTETRLFPKLKLIISSGEPLAESLAYTLKTRFPDT
eukprot:UN04298